MNIAQLNKSFELEPYNFLSKFNLEETEAYYKNKLRDEIEYSTSKSIQNISTNQIVPQTMGLHEQRFFRSLCLFFGHFGRNPIGGIKRIVFELHYTWFELFGIHRLSETRLWLPKFHKITSRLLLWLTWNGKKYQNEPNSWRNITWSGI